jgi:quinol monooxygenase YgiN
MYVSVRRYKLDPAKADELFQKVDSEFAPILKEMPGFMSYSTFDSGDGNVGSISVFSDKASVDASNAKAAEWVQGSLASLNLSAVDISEGDVRTHVR